MERSPNYPKQSTDIFPDAGSDAVADRSAMPEISEMSDGSGISEVEMSSEIALKHHPKLNWNWGMVEQVSAVAAVAATVAGVVTQQVLYASLPLSLSMLVLSQGNRRRDQAIQHMQTQTQIYMQTLAQQQEVIALLQSNPNHQNQPEEQSHYLEHKHIQPLINKLDEINRQQLRAHYEHQQWATQISTVQQETATLNVELSSLKVSLKESNAQKRKPSQSATARPHSPNLAVVQQRVGIFVDAANLYYSARSLDFTIDYERLLDLLTPAHSHRQAFFYTGIDPDCVQHQELTRCLKRIGYEVRTTEIVHYADGSTKANLDVAIAVDMVERAEEFDTIILASGDGDFASAVATLKRKGVRVEVAAFPESTNQRLRKRAHKYHNLASVQQNIMALHNDSPCFLVVPLPPKQTRKAS
jgi:uncharacterized LabA/DUF88 family protein